MSVVDTSAVVDFLLGVGVGGEVARQLARDEELAAPDVLVFEVLAVLRRGVLHGRLPARRAWDAVEDLGDLPVALFPSLLLRRRAWALRHNLTIADALFVALAAELSEPLVTKDAALAAGARKHARVDVVHLVG